MLMQSIKHAILLFYFNLLCLNIFDFLQYAKSVQQKTLLNSLRIKVYKQNLKTVLSVLLNKIFD